MLSLLIKPGKDARDTLAQFGFEAGDLRDRVADEGLLPVLQDLKTSFGDNEEAIAKVFPNIRALRGVFDLLGANLQTNVAIVDAMADSTGKLDEAFLEVTDDIEFAKTQTTSAFEAMKAEIGELVAPATFAGLQRLTEFLEGITSAISEVTTARGAMDWAEEMLDATDSLSASVVTAGMNRGQSMRELTAIGTEAIQQGVAPEDLLVQRGVAATAEDLAAGELTPPEALSQIESMLREATDARAALRAVLESGLTPQQMAPLFRSAVFAELTPGQVKEEIGDQRAFAQTFTGAERATIVGGMEATTAC